MKRAFLAVLAAAVITLGFGFSHTADVHAQAYGGQTYVLANYVAPGGTVTLPDGTVISCPTGCPAGETFTTAGVGYQTAVYGSSYGTLAYGYAPSYASYVPGYSVGIAPYTGFYGGGLTWPFTIGGFGFGGFGHFTGGGHCHDHHDCH